MKRIIVLYKDVIEEGGVVRPEAQHMIDIAPKLQGRYSTDVYIASEDTSATMGDVRGVLAPSSIPSFVRLNKSALIIDSSVAYNLFFGSVPVKLCAKELGIAAGMVRRYVRMERIEAVKGKSKRGHDIKRSSLENFKMDGRRKWGNKQNES